MRGDAHRKSARAPVADLHRVQQRRDHDRAEDARQQNQRRGQRGLTAQLFGDADGHRRGGGFRCKRGQDRSLDPEGAGDQQGREDRDARSGQQPCQHRPRRAPHAGQVVIKRQRQRHGGRPQHEMHELRAVEIGGIVGPRHPQQHRQQDHRDQHGVGPAGAAQPARHRIARQVRGQPQQRPLRQIGPDQDRITHAPGPSGRRVPRIRSGGPPR